ncbi:MAG: D-alanyl-D-alanine carboxypeptidase family protein [Acutalibacteraceae bacterium]
MKHKNKNKDRKFKVLIYFAAICLAVCVVFAVADRLPAFIGELTSAKAISGDTEEKGIPDLLVVVNSKNQGGGRTDGLVQVYEKKTSSYFVKDKNVYVDSRIMKPLNNMMDDFYKETGLKTVNVISGYRSIELQSELYKKITLQHGSTYARRFCQTPGSSEHHTGLAVDLSIFHKEDGSSEDFKGQGEYAWFYENCHKYGFVQRYEESKEDITGIGNEPWHFRYVGKKNAEYMKKHNLCLEEYVKMVKK